MLKEQKLKGSPVNNLPKDYFKDVPKMPASVRIRLHPNKFRMKRVNVVTSEDPMARVEEVGYRPVIGETQQVLSSTVWVGEGGESEQKSIIVLNQGLPHILVYPKNEGEVTLDAKNGLHQQIYYWMMIWGGCKNSINRGEKSNEDFYCEMLNDSAELDLRIEKEDNSTDAKVLIKESKDLDFLFNLAGTLGYNGDKSMNQVKAFLNALAVTDSVNVIAAFKSPDMVNLRMTIVNAMNEGIIGYKPKVGKVGIPGDAGRDFVNSDVNEDFNSRVSKLMVYFGVPGNEEDLISLKSAIEKKALAPVKDLVDAPKTKSAALPKSSDTANKIGGGQAGPIIPELD